MSCRATNDPHTPVTPIPRSRTLPPSLSAGHEPSDDDLTPRAEITEPQLPPSLRDHVPVAMTREAIPLDTPIKALRDDADTMAASPPETVIGQSSLPTSAPLHDSFRKLHIKRTPVNARPRKNSANTRSFASQRRPPNARHLLSSGRSHNLDVQSRADPAHYHAAREKYRSWRQGNAKLHGKSIRESQNRKITDTGAELDRRIDAKMPKHEQSGNVRSRKTSHYLGLFKDEDAPHLRSDGASTRHSSTSIQEEDGHFTGS